MLLTRSSVLIALLLASYTGHGQKIMPGYVITAGQDTLRGAVVVHDAETQQRQVDFITAQGSQRQTLDARALRAYGYATDQDTIHYVSVRLNLGLPGNQAEPLFLRQLVGGPVMLFRYCYTRTYSRQPARIITTTRMVPMTPVTGKVTYVPQTASSLTRPASGPLAFPPLNADDARGGTGVALLLYRKGQTDFTQATQWKFPNDALAYFADCPALRPDIQARHYKAHNLAQLVRQYNACQPGQP
ncbi:hypothetical protein [Hymenobacter agri]